MKNQSEKTPKIPQVALPRQLPSRHCWRVVSSAHVCFPPSSSCVGSPSRCRRATRLAATRRAAALVRPLAAQQPWCGHSPRSSPGSLSEDGTRTSARLVCVGRTCRVHGGGGSGCDGQQRSIVALARAAPLGGRGRASADSALTLQCLPPLTLLENWQRLTHIAATQGVSGIRRECKALQRLYLVNSRPPCSRREELPFPPTCLHHRTRSRAYLIVYIFPRVIIYKMCDTLI